ncbi:MAG TPA: hypothetical protein VNT75_12980 [Symbiobacteriaceae bacterium]|nr:hypothetical protein [Symbiobacteriaceae bacterium]
MLERAAENIARCVGTPASGTVTLLQSPGRAVIGGAVAAALNRRNIEVHTVLVANGDADVVKRTLERVEGTSGYVILLEHSFAPTVFDVLGRPDQGLKHDCRHLFCDWFLSPAGLLRTYAVDWDEQERFRARLLNALAGAQKIRVTTAAGTDITLSPRHWNSAWGEVWTAPVEFVSNGTIVVDGSVYFALTKQPFTLEIRDGRVANLHELDQSDPQQQMLWNDLTCDGQAAVLAELGIGVNLGADPRSDLMEAEQARGTCHFGFGNNVPYGGRNVSRFHGDIGVLAPTIEVDGRVIC